MDDKILQFRGISALEFSRKQKKTSDFDLFSHHKRFANKFVFVNIEDLEQQNLYRIIKLNSVKVIVDLRIFPIFQKPEFNHKEISDYFINNNLTYFDFSDLTQSIMSSPSFAPNSYKVKLKRLKSLLRGMQEGLCLILFDHHIYDQQILPYVREIISDQHSRHSELNPRSLNR